MLKPRDFLATEVSLSWNYCGGCLSESFGMYIVMLNPQMSMVGHAMIYKVIICWCHVITNRLKKTVKWITFLKPNLTMKPLFPTLTNQTLALPGSLTNKSNQNKTKPLSMLSLFVLTQPPRPLLPSIPLVIVYKFIYLLFLPTSSRLSGGKNIHTVDGWCPGATSPKLPAKSGLFQGLKSTSLPSLFWSRRKTTEKKPYQLGESKQSIFFEKVTKVTCELPGLWFWMCR